MKSKGSDRPIDKIRNSGGSFKIGEETGNIVATQNFGDRLLMVTKGGVYSIQTADQIDPERTNIKLKPAIQTKELGRGADSIFVKCTLLAAMEIFNPTHLPKEFPILDALEASLDATKRLSEIVDVIESLDSSRKKCEADLGAGVVSAAFLPHTPNLRGQCEHALSEAWRTRQKLVEISRMFFSMPPNQNWRAGVTKQLGTLCGPEDPFWPYFKEKADGLDAIINFRNAMIHPDAEKRLIVTDYSLQPDGKILTPTIEIIHPLTPAPRQDVVGFFEDQVAFLGQTFESFVGVFADRSAVRRGPFISHVTQLPEGRTQDGARITWQITLAEGFTFPSTKQEEA